MRTRYPLRFTLKGMLWLLTLASLPHTFAQTWANELQLASSRTFSQQTRQSQSLVNVLGEIKARHKVSFLYQKKNLEGKYVDNNINYDQPLDVLLEAILKPNALAFEKVKTDTYSIYSEKKRNAAGTESSPTPPNEAAVPPGSPTAEASFMAVAVSGRVTDDKGEGLPGVTVIEKGTANGTTTNAKGEYSLSAKDESSVLVFSFIGYVTEETTVGSRTTINVTLVPDLKSLDEVVVIAYGEKSRKMMTESVGVVNAKEIQKVPVASADAAIQGRVSGVQITSVDGTPGSPVAVRVRGVGTVGNAQPLFVIDGVPLGNTSGRNTNPLAILNPADIESISVLKDASAAALYGIQAANGVVIITTKRGTPGKPKITLDAYTGVQNFPRRLEWNNTAQYVSLIEEAIANRNRQEGNQNRELNPALADPNSPLRRINTDWQDAAIRKNAPMRNYNVSLTGGTDNLNYNISGGYFSQAAIVPKWDLERYSFRANSDYKVNKWIRVGQTLNISYQQVYRGMSDRGDGFLYATSSNMPPFFRIYDDPANPIPGNRYGFDGGFRIDTGGRVVPVAGITVGNALAQNAVIDTYDRTVRLLGGLYAEIEPLQGLKFRSAASIDYSTSRNTSWTPGYSLVEAGLDRTVNQFTDSRSEGINRVFTNTLTYEKTFGFHHFNALTGIEYRPGGGTSLSYTGTDFLSTDPNFYINISNGRGTVQPDGSRRFDNARGGAGAGALTGYLGRLSYDYRQKYLVTLSFRRDGSSNFAPENRFENYSAVSAAWRVSEEPFFKNIPIISDFKIRGSWGQLGNSGSLPPFLWVTRVSFSPDYGIGGGTAQAPVPANFTNRNLKWEIVESWDAGFDMSLFDNKLSILFAYYNRDTKRLLYNLPLPFTSGFPNSGVNLGQVNNRGIELEVAYNTKIGDLQLGLSGNITTVRNRLVNLADGVSEFTSGNFRTAVGYPIGYIYGYRMLGVYQTDAQANEALRDTESGTRPRRGDIIFEDNNGPAPAGSPAGVQFSGRRDSVISAADRTYLGKTIPDFFYGATINANYKGFDLSVLFYGVAGVQLYNAYRAQNENMAFYGRNQLATTQNRWTESNPSNTMPRAVEGDPYRNNRFSSRWVENAGFLRLRNIQLGYTVPKSLLNRTKAINNLRVYVAGSNLFRITQYTGLDPEVVTYGSDSNQLNAGTDNANIPQPRTYQLGVQVEF